MTWIEKIKLYCPKLNCQYMNFHFRCCAKRFEGCGIILIIYIGIFCIFIYAIVSVKFAFQMQNYLCKMWLRKQGHLLVPACGGLVAIPNKKGRQRATASAYFRYLYTEYRISCSPPSTYSMRYKSVMSNMQIYQTIYHPPPWAPRQWLM